MGAADQSSHFNVHHERYLVEALLGQEEFKFQDKGLRACCIVDCIDWSEAAVGWRDTSAYPRYIFSKSKPIATEHNLVTILKDKVAEFCLTKTTADVYAQSVESKSTRRRVGLRPSQSVDDSGSKYTREYLTTLSAGENNGESWRSRVEPGTFRYLEKVAMKIDLPLVADQRSKLKAIITDDREQQHSETAETADLSNSICTRGSSSNSASESHSVCNPTDLFVRVVNLNKGWMDPRYDEAGQLISSLSDANRRSLRDVLHSTDVITTIHEASADSVEPGARTVIIKPKNPSQFNLPAIEIPFVSLSFNYNAFKDKLHQLDSELQKDKQMKIDVLKRDHITQKYSDLNSADAFNIKFLFESQYFNSRQLHKAGLGKNQRAVISKEETDNNSSDNPTKSDNKTSQSQTSQLSVPKYNYGFPAYALGQPRRREKHLTSKSSVTDSTSSLPPVELLGYKVSSSSNRN